MKVKTEDFYAKCGCRSVGECTHDDWVEKKALDALVDQFADAMKKRLLEKYMKGWHGWDAEGFDVQHIRARIYENLYSPNEQPNDAIDIANFAAFWWNRFDE